MGMRTVGIQEGWERAVGAGRTTAAVSPPGAQNQTLQRLQQVLHVDSGPCLPHLLSRLCQDLGPGAFRLAARMYLQKGRCWWQTLSRLCPGVDRGEGDGCGLRQPVGAQLVVGPKCWQQPVGPSVQDFPSERTSWNNQNSSLVQSP